MQYGWSIKITWNFRINREIVNAILQGFHSQENVALYTTCILLGFKIVQDGCRSSESAQLLMTILGYCEYLQ